jgi:hypothetical protein
MSSEPIRPTQIIRFTSSTAAPPPSYKEQALDQIENETVEEIKNKTKAAPSARGRVGRRVLCGGLSADLLWGYSTVLPSAHRPVEGMGYKLLEVRADGE